ncbi:MAG: hypothetical protein Q9227_000908 [Pyrenula ochraceoflavens]
MPPSRDLIYVEIVAGKGDRESTIIIERKALDHSTVAYDWVKDTSSIPNSLSKKGKIYLPECEPDVVEAVFRRLEEHDEHSAKIRRTQRGESLWMRQRDPVFLVQVYKLASSLAFEPLCLDIAENFKTRSWPAQKLVETIVIAHRSGIIEHSHFKNWITTHLRCKGEKLSSSDWLKEGVMRGGEDVWTFCSALMFLLSVVPEYAEERAAEERGPDLLTPSPSPQISRAQRKDSTPGQRRYSPYTVTPRREKIRQPSKSGGHLNATVEDASETE